MAISDRDPSSVEFLRQYLSAWLEQRIRRVDFGVFLEVLDGDGFVMDKNRGGVWFFVPVKVSSASDNAQNRNQRNDKHGDGDQPEPTIDERLVPPLPPLERCPFDGQLTLVVLKTRPFRALFGGTCAHPLLFVRGEELPLGRAVRVRAFC